MLLPLYAALLHYPVTDRRGHVVSTSVTTLDVHDIARAARTFGLRGYFIVTPLEPQHWLVNRIVAHWHGGWGTEYNPSRGDALNTVRLAADLAGVGDAISEETGHDPVWVGTSARRYPNSVSFADLKARLAAPDAPPHCLVFGTGWGLHPELVAECDLVLEPIAGPTEYNHLSVRSAASIIFDRLAARP